MASASEDGFIRRPKDPVNAYKLLVQDAGVETLTKD